MTLLPALAAAAIALSAPPPLALEGAYTFSTNQTDPGTARPVCTETWTFSADGSMVVHSGEEVVEKRFRSETDRDGTWLVVRSVSTNGLPDCMGNRAAAVSDEENRILILTFNGGAVLTCPPPSHTEDGTPYFSDCYGTLRPNPAD